jgi:hypothetical protein
MSKECKRNVNTCENSPNCLLFVLMKLTHKIYFGFLGMIFCLAFAVGCESKSPDIPVEEVKVALRAVGNQLLLTQSDTTSLVFPVVEKSPKVFVLSFENALAFDPTDLNQITASVFDKANLPKSYFMEVIQCSDGEVAYSYKVTNQTEKNIIPCGGRIVPTGCYMIQLKFSSTIASKNDATFFYVLVSLVLVFLIVVFYSKYHSYHSEKEHSSSKPLGSFSFYPEQNKLVKAAQEIPLTQKECELLSIFIEYPNQVVKREELTKRVWEDNGVIVGRSLDTYISKLRKKLQDDTSIKLINIHGVGYKLEVTLQ